MMRASPTTTPYSPRRIRAQIYRSTSDIGQKRSAEKACHLSQKSRRATILPMIPEELATPDETSANKPSKHSVFAKGERPKDLATQRATIHETNGHFPSESSANGKKVERQQPTSEIRAPPKTTPETDIEPHDQASGEPEQTGAANGDKKSCGIRKSLASIEDSVNRPDAVAGSSRGAVPDPGRSSVATGRMYLTEITTNGVDISGRSAETSADKAAKLVTPYKLMRTPPKDDKPEGARTASTGGKALRQNSSEHPEGTQQQEHNKPVGNAPRTRASAAPSLGKSPDHWADIINEIDEEERGTERRMLRKVDSLADLIRWPRTRDRHAKKAAIFMREWAQATKDIEPGSAAAIKAMTNIVQGVRPKELRQAVEVALDDALPKGAAMDLPEYTNSIQFAGMLTLYAAKQLDAKEAKMRKADAKLRKAEMAKQLKTYLGKFDDVATTRPDTATPTHKPRRSSSHTSGHGESRVDKHAASHGSSEVFLKTPAIGQSTLSDEDLRDMRSDSDEPDTISPVVMAKLVSRMTTHKREETLEMLQDLADENSGKPRANKILAVIKYVAPRKGKHFPTGESYKQRKARKLADELMQKEVVRKLRKWDAVCRKARSVASSVDSAEMSLSSASSHDEQKSMEVNKGMQLPFSEAKAQTVDSPKPKQPTKPSKAVANDDDEYETHYYLMTPLERQEAREARASGGKRRRRPTAQMGMYPPVNPSDI